MVKNAFTLFVPDMNHIGSVSVSTQKWATMSEKANRYRRKSKQLSCLTLCIISSWSNMSYLLAMN